MSTYTVTLPSGEVWTPRFVQQLNPANCIGCGRCFKVCAQGVLALVGLDEDGRMIALDADAEDDEDDDEYERKVMTLAHPERCIGCTACSKICPKKCYTHAAAEV